MIKVINIQSDLVSKLFFLLLLSQSKEWTNRDTTLHFPSFEDNIAAKLLQILF